MPFDYAPAPESRSIVDIESNYGLFIGGSFTEPTSGEFFKTINPATEEVLSEVAEAGQADVDAAVAAARRAYDKTWSKMSGKDRAKYIFRIARLIQERSRELAVLETLDNGKPIRESRDVDLPLVAAHFFYHAGWADKLEFAGYGPDPKSLGVAAQVKQDGPAGQAADCEHWRWTQAILKLIPMEKFDYYINMADPSNPLPWYQQQLIEPLGKAIGGANMSFLGFTPGDQGNMFDIDPDSIDSCK